MMTRSSGFMRRVCPPAISAPILKRFMACAFLHVITANGVEVWKAITPVAGIRDRKADQMMPAFLSLFPPIDQLADFGPMRVPRLSRDDIRALESS